MFYKVALEEELSQAKKAMHYYLAWAEELRSIERDQGYIFKYYEGLLDPTKVARSRFRGLFFAMRLQPVLTYIGEFTRQHGHAPYILDLGCGFGLETLILALNGAKAHGIDRAASKIAFASKRGTGYQEAHDLSLDLRYDSVDLFDFNPPSPYDAVYSNATLHHIEPLPDALEAIVHLIRPEGYFFLSEENGYSPIQQISVQRKIGWTQPRKLWHTDPNTGERYLYGNENIRAPCQWARHMKQVGLVPQSIKYCRFLPPLNWPIEQLVWIERFLRNIPLITQLSAIGFLLIACRPPEHEKAI
jgi:2-polyprenyl-3-methyl-5-hydroxy-6-metoxy-1,4-benzoquinol methylase